MTQIKKGDLVTKIASWDRTGTVYVTHYVVSSWGKKQATLVKVNDQTNAKFRVYTDRTSLLQGVHSQVIIPTSTYNDELALRYAAEFIKEEDRRAEQRYQGAVGRYEDPSHVPYGQDKASYMSFEQRIYDQHKAAPWKAAVKVMS